MEHVDDEEQELVIGRTKLNDIELPNKEKPANSHLALNAIVGPDGEERKILRYNMPFGSFRAEEFGTYDIAYARSRLLRADAHQHVHRRSARKHRPHPRLLDGRHRDAVLVPTGELLDTSLGPDDESDVADGDSNAGEPAPDADSDSDSDSAEPMQWITWGISGVPPPWITQQTARPPPHRPHKQCHHADAADRPRGRQFAAVDEVAGGSRNVAAAWWRVARPRQR